MTQTWMATRSSSEVGAWALPSGPESRTRIQAASFHFYLPVGTRVSRAVKRTMDVAGAAVLLVLTLPLTLLIAALVFLEHPGSVLYRQVRLGQNLVPYEIRKFRTMRPNSHDRRDAIAHLNEAEFPLFKVAADPRVTRLGRVLRRTSLDELPQLWNVLVGDMSLVGPRPPLPDEVAADRVHQALRLRVRPGMTGLSQVNGRATLSYAQMLAYDLSYVEQWSPWRDARILFRTIFAVVGGRGAF